MKRFFVLSAVLLGACSSVPPSAPLAQDPFAQNCRAQSSRSCPGDTDTPIRLSGESRPRG